LGLCFRWKYSVVSRNIATGDVEAEISTSLKQALKLAQEPALHFYDIARLLVELHEHETGALPQMIEASTMSRRRMYYLLRVGQLIETEKLSRAEAEEIGWTKLQIIARYIDALGAASVPDFADLAVLASKHKARDLPFALRGKRVVRKKVVQFYLSMGGRALLNEALIQHGAKQTGKRLMGKEEALIRLARAAFDLDSPT
jgi:hypothetical protein